MLKGGGGAAVGGMVVKNTKAVNLTLTFFVLHHRYSTKVKKSQELFSKNFFCKNFFQKIFFAKKQHGGLLRRAEFLSFYYPLDSINLQLISKVLIELFSILAIVKVTVSPGFFFESAEVIISTEVKVLPSIATIISYCLIP